MSETPNEPEVLDAEIEKFIEDETTALAVREAPPSTVIATRGQRAVEFQEILPGPDTQVIIATDKATRILTTPKAFAEIKCPGMPWPKALEILMLCRRSCIDPYGGELFVDKKRNDRGSFDYLTVLSKRAFFRLAQSHPQYHHMTYVEFPAPEDCKESNQAVIWGKASVWRRDSETPYEYTLFYDEAVSQVGKGGIPYKRTTGYCAAQPRQYLRLVCLARAFRDAFSDVLTGFYSEDEIK